MQVKLRGYQQSAVDAITAALQEHRSTLVVMATGLGKTPVFCEVASQCKGRVLVLAHRQELVNQAQRALQTITGEMVGLEMAEHHASPYYRYVVGSIDTVKQRVKTANGWSFPRMESMGDFDLIITDEAHHYVAATYRRPMDFWKEAKVLGVTATPDRKDEKALGQIFESVAMVHDILDGIQDGYLVPGRGCSVWLEDLDISDVKTVAGDLAQGALDDATLNACEAITQHILELEPERQGILFFPGVKSAHYAAERFNVLKPGSACSIDGKTPRHERDAIVRAYKRGEYQYLCNCQIATEGFDHPRASFVVPRLTKSRALYAQMVGRVTRVLPGTVEHLDEPGERREAIATSGKPSFTIYDFVGNAGRHALVTARDALGGKHSEAVIKHAKKKGSLEGDYDIEASLEEAERELQTLARQPRARVVSRREAFDPFEVLAISDADTLPVERFRFDRFSPPSRKQIEACENMGIKPKEIEGKNKGEISNLIGTLIGRRKQGMCSGAQLKTLHRFGVDGKEITFDAASRGIDYIDKCGWKKNRVDPATLSRLLGD